MGKGDISTMVQKFILFIRYKLYVEVFPKITFKFQKATYLIQEKLDPSPRKRNQESDVDWYKRINIKYALRHAEFFYLQSRYTNSMYRRWVTCGDFGDYPKAYQKEIKGLANLVNEMAYRYEENYRTLLIRERVENQLRN